jgi:diguanylate cyclase (GGDEF)-like protein
MPGRSRVELDSILQQVPAYARTLDVQKALSDALREVAKEAYFDDLTKLPNRTALEAAGRVYDKRPDAQVAVVFIDLAGFKELNDSHGHAAGNAGLAALGQDLASLAKGKEGQAYRHGGDEFVVTVPAAALTHLLSQATRLLWPLPFEHNDRKLELRANMGHALPEKNVVLGDLIRRADAACRVAKANADGRPVAWTANMEAEAPESSRRKCVTCGATTTVLVPTARRAKDHLTRCGNCQTDFTRGAG